MSTPINEDPVDRIAEVFKNFCSDALARSRYALRISGYFPTYGQAAVFLHQYGNITADDTNQLKIMRDDLPRLERCVDRIWDIKCLARRVFADCFSADSYGDGDEARRVFDQEICFSYACKMLVSMGPFAEHFKVRPTCQKLVDAELALALRAPVYEDRALEPHEDEFTLTPVRGIAAREEALNATPTKKGRRDQDTEDVLVCRESMPTPKQIRRSRPPQPVRSCRR